MKLRVFKVILPLFWCLKSLAMPVEQDAVTDVAEATPFPDLKKSFVDIKNVSPEVSIILKDYNVSLVSILQQQQELQNKTRYVTPTPTFPPPTAPKEVEEALRLNSIKTSLEKTLRKSDDSEGQLNAEFDYSLSSVCEVPKPINLSEWFDQSTWNILFKPNFKQYNVKSVFLRLFKVSTLSKSSGECETDSGEFYKMTVSMYYRKKREIKKRIIFAKMISSTFNGWVEVDALSTVRLWDSLRNNLGLAVDMYDMDENQLNAKEHFHLQNCEAGPTLIPWRGIGLFAKSTGSKVTEDVLEIYRNVYTGPRFDLVSSTPANYFISSNELVQERTRHSRHTNHHRRNHFPRSSEESFEHKSHRRDRSHRGSNSVEET